jgi:hypothetical protein
MKNKFKKSIVTTLFGTLMLSFSLTAMAKQHSTYSSSSSTLNEQVFNLKLKSGETQRLLYVVPAKPRATLLMFPGGEGNLDIYKNGGIKNDHNFVVRTRAQWVEKGYAVLIPDSIDHDNLRGLRSSSEYAELIKEIVRFAHRNTDVPIFLLGTSQGSIAAMNGAAHLTEGQIAGVILTESVSVLGGSHETVFDADPQRVIVPALVVANRDDTCKVAPPTMAPKIAEAMSHSSDVKIIYVSGGTQKTENPCGSLTPHGYYGIEQEVVDKIATWVSKHNSN